MVCMSALVPCEGDTSDILSVGETQKAPPMNHHGLLCKMMYFSERNDHGWHHAHWGYILLPKCLIEQRLWVRSGRDRTSYFSRWCRGLPWQMSLFLVHRAGQKSNMPTPRWTMWRLRDQKPVTCMTIQLFLPPPRRDIEQLGTILTQNPKSTNDMLYRGALARASNTNVAFGCHALNTVVRYIATS